eukprot:606224-Pyramimonas_sp.AAC.1
MIDYVVCSRALHPYPTLNADLKPPFKTHARLGVALDMEALVEPVCQRSKHREIPGASGPDNHWRTDVAEASSSLLEAPLAMPGDMVSSLPEHAVDHMSGDSGMPHLTRPRALELQALFRARCRGRRKVFPRPRPNVET